MDKYNFKDIESKWNKIWNEQKIDVVDIQKAKKPYFNLMMFPYPSAEGMHVGNMYAFTASDVFGRYKRMQGFDVFEPIGLDGFGIHSENYALKIGRHPKEHARITEENFYRQLKMVGNMYDWTKTVETYNPNYYKWTQWIFVQMFKKGLAYRAKSEVNWCPKCKTVLSDEQVLGDKCERCGTVVVKKSLEQWFFKITAYAEKLLKNLDWIDWTPKIKTIQKNWIGKKDGIEIRYPIKGTDEEIICFTTAPVNFGMTFIVVSPEYELVTKILQGEIKVSDEDLAAIKKYVADAGKKKDSIENKEKTGVFTGLYATNRIAGWDVPVWISDFVLKNVGTGAVQGCPAHDTRDFEFAKKFGIPIKRVVMGTDGDMSEVDSLDKVIVSGMAGTMVNSKFLNGLDFASGLQATMDYIEKNGWGKRVVAYHLRDWLISRQRYWGPPIPMINCLKCGWQPVPENQLPVLLPDIADYQPKGEGKGPLAGHPEFYKTTCPKCGGNAERETDVSDTFLDSAWYFLRYPSVGLDDKPWDKDLTKKWLPAAMYTGGAEHATLHLMYTRFVTMALKDMGYLDFEEPFTKFFAHGMIIKDGAKMSKSKGNIVNPDEYIIKFGADAFRIYLMFLGPVSDGGDFRDSGIEGIGRWLNRLWRLFMSQIDQKSDGNGEVESALQRLIKKAGEVIEMRKYNLVIAGVMEFLNLVQAHKAVLTRDQWGQLIRILAPLAPHIAEEMWQRLGNTGFVHQGLWPEYDPRLVVATNAIVAIQVNGKLRDKLADGPDIQQRAAESAKVQQYLKGAKYRTVFVPGKVINFVTE